MRHLRFKSMFSAMRILVTLIAASIFCTSSVLAETDRSRIERSFAKRPDGRYVLEPGLTVEASFDRSGAACVFRVSGKLTEDQIMQAFNQLVPAKERGAKKLLGLMECAGGCTKMFDYKKMTLFTGVVGTQRRNQRLASTSNEEVANQLLLKMTRDPCKLVSNSGMALVLSLNEFKHCGSEQSKDVDEGVSTSYSLINRAN
jgi:hypothetical protein